MTAVIAPELSRALGGELARAQPSALFEDVQAAAVGPVDAHQLPGRLVDELGGPLPRTDLLDQGCQQSLA